MPGQDLTRVTIPAFFLEPRSLLERMADTMMHPDLLLGVSKLEGASCVAARPGGGGVARLTPPLRVGPTGAQIPGLTLTPTVLPPSQTPLRA